MPYSSKPQNKRTPDELAEVFAGYFASRVQGLAGDTVTEHNIRNALISTQEVLGKNATFAAAAAKLTAALPATPPATTAPTAPGAATPATATPSLADRINRLATLLDDKQQKNITKLSADLDGSIRDAELLSRQLKDTKAKLETEKSTLQTKTGRTSEDEAKLATLSERITNVQNTTTKIDAASGSAKTALDALPTSKRSTYTLTTTTLSQFAAQSAGERRLKELQTAFENATTKQYRQTNKLFAALGGSIPPQIDSSVIAELKKQASDDATKKMYDTIEERINTLNKKLNELNQLQAELVFSVSAENEKKHTELRDELTKENIALAKMFRDAQDLLGAHAKLEKKSAELERLTVQCGTISCKAMMPILGNATLELTKDELKGTFSCGTRDWDKADRKWKRTELNVHPTAEDLVTFVTNWNASLEKWNKEHPFAEQKKRIELKGNPPDYTGIACGSKENRDNVLKEFIPAMEAAEKARTKSTVTSSAVSAAPSNASTTSITAVTSSATATTPPNNNNTPGLGSSSP